MVMFLTDRDTYLAGGADLGAVLGRNTLAGRRLLAPPGRERRVTGFLALRRCDGALP